jgi:hypothetical protein
MSNGVGKIEVIKPFGEAFELMKKILFQPFDLKKWCVIGFAAWLSQLGSGNYNFRTGKSSDWSNVPGYQEFHDTISQIPTWVLISGGIALVLLLIVLLVLFAWLRARGRFMFVDCIVKNRGAVAEPWREFRTQGNSYFLFSLIVGCIVLMILGVASLPFMLPIVRGVTFLHMHDFYLFSMIALWAVLLVLIIIAWGLIAHFMVAIMYRRRCLAKEAFYAALSLIWNYPGEITLYCLSWIVVVIGAGIVSCTAILATCCIALLPYIGTVILLPIILCLRAYGLFFIRQFGPDYDVFTTVAQPPLPPAVEPPIPPPLPA